MTVRIIADNYASYSYMYVLIYIATCIIFLVTQLLIIIEESQLITSLTFQQARAKIFMDFMVLRHPQKLLFLKISSKLTNYRDSKIIILYFIYICTL